jgi:hypothetical protein
MAPKVKKESPEYDDTVPVEQCDRVSDIAIPVDPPLPNFSSDTKPSGVMIAILNRVMRKLHAKGLLMHIRTGQWVLKHGVNAYLPMLTARSKIQKQSGWRNLSRDDWLMGGDDWAYIWESLTKEGPYVASPSGVRPEFPSLDEIIQQGVLKHRNSENFSRAYGLPAPPRQTHSPSMLTYGMNIKTESEQSPPAPPRSGILLSSAPQLPASQPPPASRLPAKRHALPDSDEDDDGETTAIAKRRKRHCAEKDIDDEFEVVHPIVAAVGFYTDHFRCRMSDMVNLMRSQYPQDEAQAENTVNKVDAAMVWPTGFSVPECLERIKAIEASEIAEEQKQQLDHWKTMHAEFVADMEKPLPFRPFLSDGVQEIWAKEELDEEEIDDEKPDGLH